MGAVDGCSCASLAHAYEVCPHQRSACNVHRDFPLPKRRMIRHNSPLLYLIGVNHVVQFGEPSGATNSRVVREKRASSKAHALEAIEKQDITILAEESTE